MGETWNLVRAFFSYFSCIWWLTFLPDDDSFLRNGCTCSSACFRIQIKLVACAVLEVGQSDRGLIGSQGQLLHWAQFIGVIYYRGEGWARRIMGWGWKLGSSGVSWIESWVGGRCRWSVSDDKGGNGSIWGVGFRNRRQEWPKLICYLCCFNLGKNQNALRLL